MLGVGCTKTPGARSPGRQDSQGTPVPIGVKADGGAQRVAYPRRHGKMVGQGDWGKERQKAKEKKAGAACLSLSSLVACSSLRCHSAERVDSRAMQKQLGFGVCRLFGNCFRWVPGRSGDCISSLLQMLSKGGSRPVLPIVCS